MRSNDAINKFLKSLTLTIILALSSESNANVDKLENFLDRISYIESRRGANMNHRLVVRGMHKGTRAYGKYGLMPLTVIEVAKRLPKDKTLDKIRGVSKYLINGILINSPEIEQTIITFLAMRLGSRMKWDLNRMAYGWRHGTNYRYSSVTELQLEVNPYVQAFQKVLPLE